jgi:hypothetical protein
MAPWQLDMLWQLLEEGRRFKRRIGGRIGRIGVCVPTLN